MKKLYEKLKNYSLNDFIKYEEQDRQFIALKNLWNNFKIKDEKLYLNFIITNSLVCYQLSGLGEDYWEEFNIELGKYLNSGKSDIYIFFEKFLPLSKANKRLLEIKLKRIIKLIPFFDKLGGKHYYFYQNMNLLQDNLAKIMKQKKDAKTINFAVKMFSYGSRICFDKMIYFPYEINISIDSRIKKIFDIYSSSGDDIKNFYTTLAKKLNVPQMHLDAILRTKIEL